MPRQIIDTESGRPAYVRRIVGTVVLVLVVVALVVYVIATRGWRI